jgi:activator of 2-hydroxyglutaryl-CoA dehydratase
MKVHLGVDVGSVTTKFAILDQQDELVTDLYSRTMGRPVQIVQEGLQHLARQAPAGVEVASVGVTGSARRLTGIVVGADVVRSRPMPWPPPRWCPMYRPSSRSAGRTPN